MQGTIEEVIKTLKAQGTTLAVAESCTGGRIASAFTALAGASDYFLGGVVSYSNDMKVNMLGVDASAIERQGAVSREVAEQMATGMRRVSGADFAIATTGIAGPGGGSAGKPVGTVWIAVAGPDGSVSAQKMLFGGSRAEIMEAATEAAIGMLAPRCISRPR